MWAVILLLLLLAACVLSEAFCEICVRVCLCPRSAYTLCGLRARACWVIIRRQTEDGMPCSFHRGRFGRYRGAWEQSGTGLA